MRCIWNIVMPELRASSLTEGDKRNVVFFSDKRGIIQADSAGETLTDR